MSEEHLLSDYSSSDPDKLCYMPTASKATDDTQEYLLYFISGNPGLISFYEPFLSKLHELRSKSPHPRFHICAHSLKGFELSPQAQHPNGPFNLDEQIEYQEDLLYEHVRNHSPSAAKTPKVILMGHSVGAYILMELIRRHKEYIETKNQADVDLIGAVMIFPTIADIAKSPLGKVARIILPLPGFATAVGLLGRGMASILPHSVFVKVVKMITRFPNYAASATAAFVKSRKGVRQALYLAKDEMETITDYKWKDEVFGAATSSGTNNRDTINWNNRVYWGKNDKWVANETRDAMIKARSSGSHTLPAGLREEMKPSMEIDNHGIRHDFCTTIGNSHLMANKVNGWIDELVDAHHRALAV